MTDQLLVDLDPVGRASVAIWLDGDEFPDLGEKFQLTWPVDDDALSELRWYLEDYLAAPFGVYGERGPRVQAQLPTWGMAVFGAVFGSGPGREAYLRVRSQSASARVVFLSSSPRLLGLPWELMRDPDRPMPLALDMAGMGRGLKAAELADTVPVPSGKLRVLMVISRPAGSADVEYQMIARPLLKRLQAVRGQVDLVVLRPPTLSALAEELATAADGGEPFQVVHFDGHGILEGDRSWEPGNAESSQGREAEGVLVFEKPGGGSDYVPASRVAQVLKAAQVPVVVLNACQSGAIGRNLEAAVATRLLQEGTASVVAMAYSVYAVAVAEFMAAFYDRLFAGDPVSAAVGAGRQRMFAQNERPSPKGNLPLDDWLVPVHYLRRDVSFPQARMSRAGPLSLAQELDQIRAEAREQSTGDLDPVGSFTGRDALFYELEVAARLQRVVVLHGPGGTGKTELAKAFGRWWRDTGGVEDAGWVFMHSFEPGVATFGLSGVISQIGRRIFGTDFDKLETADRRATVEEALANRRMLLIWDNFETVRSMPDPGGATRLLDEDGCQELVAFVGRLADNGLSAVLITSRAAEDWLGNVGRITVGGLTPREADKYADYLLAPYPAATPRRANRAFGELMEWLGGHPLSMRLVLPHLDAVDADSLLKALRGTVPLPSDDGNGGGRMTSLPASIAYSYRHLGKSARRLLPAVGLFQAVADEEVLTLFSKARGIPGRFKGATSEAWRHALGAAAAVGLLTPLGDGMYLLHPALPAYLAAQWRAEEPAHYSAKLKAATRGFVEAYAQFAVPLNQQIRTGDAGFAYEIIGLQRHTLGSMLGYALADELWGQAGSIFNALSRYWESAGQADEADSWGDRVRLATEGAAGTLPPLDSLAGSLWLSVTNSRADRQAELFLLDEAESTYRKTLDRLLTLPSSPVQKFYLANVYHYLGSIAQRRGQLNDAEDWYRKALAIQEDLGTRAGMSASYHQLGIVAQERRLFDEADDWFRKSLAIAEDLGSKDRMMGAYHQRGMAAQQQGRLDAAEDSYRKAAAIARELGNTNVMAMTYHQLGSLAEDRGRLDEAEDWCRQSLTITEKLGNEQDLAPNYQLLGTIARNRGRPDDAEQWYRKALVITEDLGDQKTTVSTYNLLGTLARMRYRLDDAEEWYRKALAISTERGDLSAMAAASGQLGLVAEDRGQFGLALEWLVRSVSLFDEFPHPSAMPGPIHLARLAARLGMEALEECWRKVTGNSLPPPVRHYVESDTNK